MNSLLLPSDSGLDRADVTDLRIAACVGVGAAALVDLVIPVTGSTPGEVFAEQNPREVPLLAFRSRGIPVAIGPGWPRHCCRATPAPS